MKLFTKTLSPYEDCGKFTLRADETLVSVCNAPKDKSGVYLVFKNSVKPKHLMYIGASGKVTQPGTLANRKDGGLNARIRQGHHRHTKKPRRQVWPQLLIDREMKSIVVCWYATTNGNQIIAIPSVVEALLIDEYFEQTGELPDWNKKY